MEECSVECGVWSVECGVWSVECGVWECGSVGVWECGSGLRCASILDGVFIASRPSILARTIELRFAEQV